MNPGQCRYLKPGYNWAKGLLTPGWTNEGPAVPICDPANLRKVDEQSINFHRGEKSLWSFTAACCCDAVVSA